MSLDLHQIWRNQDASRDDRNWNASVLSHLYDLYINESKSSQLSHDVEYFLSNLTKPWGSATGVEHPGRTGHISAISIGINAETTNSATLATPWSKLCWVQLIFSRRRHITTAVSLTLWVSKKRVWCQCFRPESPKADSWHLLTSPDISWQCLQRLQQIDPHKMGQTRRSTKHSNRSRPCRRRCWFHPGGKNHVMSSLRRPSRGSVVWVVSVVSLSRPNKLKALGPCSTGHTCITKCRFTNYTDLKKKHTEKLFAKYLSLHKGFHFVCLFARMVAGSRSPDLKS